VQLTTEIRGVGPSLQWHPIEQKIFYTANSQIRYIESARENRQFGMSWPLTNELDTAPQSLCLSADGTILAFTREFAGYSQIFTISLPNF
jgi:hypothetical protein